MKKISSIALILLASAVNAQANSGTISEDVPGACPTQAEVLSRCTKSDVKYRGDLRFSFGCANGESAGWNCWYDYGNRDFNVLKVHATTKRETHGEKLNTAFQRVRCDGAKQLKVYIQSTIDQAWDSWTDLDANRSRSSTKNDRTNIRTVISSAKFIVLDLDDNEIARKEYVTSPDLIIRGRNISDHLDNGYSTIHTSSQTVSISVAGKPEEQIFERKTRLNGYPGPISSVSVPGLLNCKELPDYNDNLVTLPPEQ